MANELLDDVRVVLKAFDDGVFVRNTEADHEPGWAIKLLPIVAALGRLARATDPSLHTWDGPAPTALRDEAGQLVDDPIREVPE